MEVGKDEVEEVPEPAAVVVNHLANKRIEYVENKRRLKEEREQLELLTEEEEVEAQPVAKHKHSRKENDFMSQIEADVEKPVAAAKNAVAEDADVDLILSP